MLGALREAPRLHDSRSGDGMLAHAQVPQGDVAQSVEADAPQRVGACGLAKPERQLDAPGYTIFHDLAFIIVGVVQVPSLIDMPCCETVVLFTCSMGSCAVTNLVWCRPADDLSMRPL